MKSECFVCDLFGCPADIHDENEVEWIIENRDSQEFELNHQGKMKHANPANNLLTESGKRSVVKRSRPTESPRKMSYLALDRRTAKPPFVGSNPTRASKLFGKYLFCSQREVSDPRTPQKFCVFFVWFVGIEHARKTGI